MKNNQDLVEKVNYATVNSCFNCTNRYTLRDIGQSICDVNISEKDTRRARYAEVDLNGICNLWKAR